MSVINIERIQSSLQRILSLEGELVDAANAGQMSTADFNRRSARLAQVKAHFLRIEQSLTQSGSQLAISSDGHFELPLMNDCSRAEQMIIDEYVKDTKGVIEQLAKRSKTVLDWSKDAAGGKGNWIKTAIRLSRLGSYVSVVEYRLNLIRRMRKSLEHFITKLAPPGGHATSKVGTAGLVDAFREFETTMARIARLRLDLRSAVAKNLDMDRWLSRYESKRRLVSPTMDPPAPDDVLAAGDGVWKNLKGASERANERLVIATRLASTLDSQSEPIMGNMPVEPLEEKIGESFEIVPVKKMRRSGGRN